MDKVSRRKAIGAVAASAVAATATAATAYSAEGGGKERPPLKRMSLEEFRKLKEKPEIEAVLKQLNGQSFVACHVSVREETGIWIPELLPVFQKLDAKLTFGALPKLD